MINTDPNHVHTYNAEGKITCCTLEDRVYGKAGADNLLHGVNPDDSKPVQKTGLPYNNSLYPNWPLSEL